jgi:hypothetical protein
MNLENIEKKLREARFFLEQMREWEDRAFGRDKEPFDFFLSAHLSAGKSVDWRLCREQPAYRAWRTAWNDSHPKEDALLKFLADDRAREVHQSGSGRTASHVQIPFRGEYSDKSGTATYTDAPWSDGYAIIEKQIHCFQFNGTERPVVDLCAEYCDVLANMLAQFKAGNTVP